jgi:hypothetical protein
MAVFQHPHLTRGVVTTPKGSFVISRGFLIAPDEIGESFGWRRVDLEQDAAGASVRRDSSLRPHASVERQ